METVSRTLLTFLLNALWQVPVAAAAAALVCRFLRRGPARHRYVVWAAALAAAIVIPAASIRGGDSTPKPKVAISVADLLATAAPHTISHSAPQPSLAPVLVPPHWTVDLAHTTAVLLLGAYLIMVLLRLAWVLRAMHRTVQIRRTARPSALPETIGRVTSRCQAAFGLPHMQLLFSSRVSGPVTAGRTIILPESFRAETSADVLTTAIGHEMAHIARHDFSFNLLYELFYLPVSSHPAAWLIRREIERAREIACDELVTERLIEPGAYARSIVSIATAMTALPRPGYTLGVFDGDILEERIHRLVERPAANLKRARLLLVTGLTTLALCGVAASTVALTARAQGAADGVLQQAQAAFRSGDNQRAAQLAATVVQLEPANLKARLLLAGAMLNQYVPGTDASNPVLTGARQQYFDVLARDPRNQLAFDGLVLSYTYSKQFAEARNWALQAIQANANDTFAYYSVGFLDWSLTYPDYASARLAAGMKPEDPGIIPDAGLRQNVRAQHIGQIEEGLRMLEVALQHDPDYSDAMAYTNLLDRIKAGIVDDAAQSADLMVEANSWVTKALEARRKRAQNPATPTQDTERAQFGVLAPPPPPPPPPPPLPGSQAGSGIQINGDAQAAKLVKQTNPVIPPQALQAGISGTVRLQLVIAKEGTVQNIRVWSGHPLLAAAVMDAVRQWVYQPTFVNGQPVEVTTTVNVTIAPRGQ